MTIRRNGKNSGKFPFRIAATLSVCPALRENIYSFQPKNLIPFDTYWDRITLNNRWRAQLYRIQHRQISSNGRILMDQEYLYISSFGQVRKHPRIVSNWYKEEYEPIGREQDPSIATFSIRDKTLISGSLEGTCSISVDMETLAINKQLINTRKEAVRFVDCDGKDAFITASSCETKEWRLDTEWGLYELSLQRQARTDYVTCLKMSPDGHQFFRSHANLLTLVDRETGVVRSLECESDMALDVAWSPSPFELITGHRDGSLRLFDLRTKFNTQIFNKCPWNLSLAVISPWTVICGYRANFVKVFDIRQPTQSYVTGLGPFEDEKQATLKQIAADSHHLHVALDNQLISCDFNSP